MKKLSLLLLCFVPMMGFGQDRGKWTVSTHFQTDHNFIDQKVHDIYYIHAPDIYYKPSFQFTTGVGINYRLPKNLEFSTGLRFSQKNQDLVYWNYFCGTGMIDCLPPSYNPITRQFLEIPLTARYYFLPGKFKLHVESGWNTSYRLGKSPSSTKPEWILGAQGGFGVNYFMNRLQIGLGVNYSYRKQFGGRTFGYRLNQHVFGLELKTAFTINN